MKDEPRLSDVLNDVPGTGGHSEDAPEGSGQYGSASAENASGVSSSHASNQGPSARARWGDSTSETNDAGPSANDGNATADVPSDVGGGSKHGRSWKIFAILGAGCLGINALLITLFFATITVTLSTCTSSCSDNPVGDSREDAAFIASLEANERDVQVFDALRPCIETLYNRQAAWDADESHSADVPPAPDEMRSSLVAGAWPKDDMRDALSPRVWVRIAELSQDWIERESSERWEVVDFAYPYPDNGPVPFPAKRDENSYTCTLVRCTSGADEGLYAKVRYYRWRSPAVFESDLEDERAQRVEREERVEHLEGMDSLQGRSFLCDEKDLYVWEQGEGDPLRDPDAFVAFATEMADYLGDYAHITLLAADTPVCMARNSISSKYPNEWPVEQVSLEEARKRLARGGSQDYFDHARGDDLLSTYRRPDSTITLEDLTGTLAPTKEEDYRVPNMRTGEGTEFDEELAHTIAGEVDVTDANDVIAISEREQITYEGGDPSYGDDSLSAWVVLPRGSMPETPEAFCDAVAHLRDTVWDQMTIVEGHRTSLALRIYVVDSQTIQSPSGEALDFAQARAQLVEDPTVLGDYSFEVLLAIMPYSTLWEDSDERNDLGCEIEDIGGSIARSRDWRYSAE